MPRTDAHSISAARVGGPPTSARVRRFARGQIDDLPTAWLVGVPAKGGEALEFPTFGTVRKASLVLQLVLVAVSDRSDSDYHR